MLLPLSLSSALQLICLSSVMFETKMIQNDRKIQRGCISGSRLHYTACLVLSLHLRGSLVHGMGWGHSCRLSSRPPRQVVPKMVTLALRCSSTGLAAGARDSTCQSQSLFNCKVLQCLLHFARTAWRGVMKIGKCKGLTYQQCLAQQPQCAWPSHWVAPVWLGNQLCISLILLPSADCAWLLEVLHVAAAAEKPTCTARIRGLFGISCSSQFIRRCRGVELYLNLVRSRVR